MLSSAAARAKTSLLLVSVLAWLVSALGFSWSKSELLKK